MKSEREHRDDVVRFGKLLWERGYVAATDGNISVRLDRDLVLATPTGMSKGMMQPEDLVIVDLGGSKRAGTRNVSSEIAMHTLIYRMRPDVNAVVHAHPTTATGFAAAGIALDEPLLSEAVIGLGCIPLARYGTPGTRELSDSLEPLISEYDAILMANHGVVTCAPDLLRAFMNMESVEHCAKIALTARMLGQRNLLTDEQVHKLMDARTRYENGCSDGNGGAKHGSRRPPRPTKVDS